MPNRAQRSKVTHVTDGDTAYLRPLDYGEKVKSWPGRGARFIGINTPETYGDDECYAQKASSFTTRKLQGERVRVTYGDDPVDQYGRALVYIWRKGRFFNAVLVRRGFARVTIYQPNDRYERRLRRAQRQARKDDRGLWGACL